MLDLLWMAGDIWMQLFWVRWLSYIVVGVIAFIVFIYWWVSHKQFRVITQHFTSHITHVTQHQKVINTNLVNNTETLTFLKHLKKAYILSQIKMPWSQIWSLAGLFSVVLIGFIFLQTNSWLFALSSPLFVFGFVSLIIVFKSLDQRKKLVEQVPLFLQALSNSLQAGYTLPMALDFIADEMAAPIQDQVHIINQKLSLQIPLTQALQEFADQVRNPEVDFFVESTLIQLKTGGNLISLFNKISHLIEEKLKLKRDIRSFTSQGKMSGILIATLWPVSVLAFSWLSPTHTEVLFNTPAGQLMLLVSLFLELLGFFFIWKIISVKL